MRRALLRAVVCMTVSGQAAVCLVAISSRVRQLISTFSDHAGRRQGHGQAAVGGHPEHRQCQCELDSAIRR